MAEEELREVPVQLGKRARGRPKGRRPQDARRRPAYQVIPTTFACLCCDSEDVAPAPELPLYCSACYNRLLLEGHEDPTEDVALVHFLWSGKQLEGLTDEQAERVAMVARAFEI